MNGLTSGRVSPAVGRLIFATVAAFIALRTVLTAPGVAASLRFDPQFLAERPWTPFSYLLVHENVLHLLVTVLVLVVIGPRVERVLGEHRFTLFYLYAAAGAALAAVPLSQVAPISPMSGGLAPGLGLVYAYVWAAGDREVALDPLPIRARVITLAAALVGGCLLLGAVRNDAGLSLAHVAAVPAAWLFFRLAGAGRRTETIVPLPIRRPAMAPMQVRQADQGVTPATPASTIPVSMGVEDAAEAVNRLLDKISAKGVESLTADERRVLTEYAQRKKEQP
jgi:membrane associated rhomboid family serine protease